MAATEDSPRQAVDLDNLIQEYLQFEKVSWSISTFLCGHAFRHVIDRISILKIFSVFCDSN